MENEIEALANVIRSLETSQILVVTGAGVSHASGIPTFRGSDPGAIWTRDVTELGTFSYFREDPAGSWQWYLSRFDGLEHARPNDGHRSLVALEQWQCARGGDFLLITQNIDTLHEQAGSRALVKVHGTSDRCRCATVGCSYGSPKGSIATRDVDFATFRANPSTATVPRCPRCGDFLRAHVLWFDEYYHEHEDYQFVRAERAAKREAALVIFAGTSFSVGVTDMILRAAAHRDVPIYNIDPTPRLSYARARNIAAGAETAFPALCKVLGVPTT